MDYAPNDTTRSLLECGLQDSPQEKKRQVRKSLFLLGRDMDLFKLSCSDANINELRALLEEGAESNWQMGRLLLGSRGLYLIVD